MVRNLVCIAVVLASATSARIAAAQSDPDPPAESSGGASGAGGDSERVPDPDERSDGEGSSRGVEKGTFGLGLYVGEPTGVAAKLYLKDDQAVQGAFGFAFAGDGFQIHADYVFHPYILQDKEAFTMPVYFGPGVRFIQYRAGRAGDRYIAVGARGVAGLLFDFKEIPLDVFVELAAVVEYGFADNAGLGLTFNAGAGARYYF